MHTPMQTANRYLLVAVYNVHYEDLVKYWADLTDKGMHKARMPEVRDPTVDDFLDMIYNPANINFLLFDGIEGRWCAETMLNNVQGLCAQVHFSIHPQYHGPQAIAIAKAGAEQLFQLQCSQSKQPLRTLIGMTPQNNSLALRLIKKVGFKVFDILEDLFYNAELNTYVDGCISKLRVEDLYGR